MRSPTVFLCAVAALAACRSAPDADAAEWRDVQRQRLVRLHQPRDAAAALAALRAQEPGSGRDEAGRHLDQREPAAIGAGPRRYQGSVTPIAVAVDAGVGTLHARVPGTVLDDRVAAASVRLLLDTAAGSDRGAGLQLRATASDDDLFAGRLVSDGVSPAPAAAVVRGVDAFPHVRFDSLLASGCATTWRAGLFLDWLDVEHRSAGVDRSWLSVGPRFTAEPSWVLLGDLDGHLDAFARVGLDAGVAWFQEQYRGGAADDVTVRAAASLGVGLRYSFGSLQAELGYDVEQRWFGGVDADLLGDDTSGASFGQQRLYFGFGTRF